MNDKYKKDIVSASPKVRKLAREFGVTLISDGSFYGPDGKEFGNIFSVSDTDNGSIEIRGATVVKKQDN